MIVAERTRRIPDGRPDLHGGLWAVRGLRPRCVAPDPHGWRRPVSEGPRVHVFAVVDGVLYTPEYGQGIHRAHAIEIAASRGRGARRGDAGLAPPCVRRDLSHEHGRRVMPVATKGRSAQARPVGRPRRSATGTGRSTRTPATRWLSTTRRRRPRVTEPRTEGAILANESSATGGTPQMPTSDGPLAEGSRDREAVGRPRFRRGARRCLRGRQRQVRRWRRQHHEHQAEADPGRRRGCPAGDEAPFDEPPMQAFSRRPPSAGRTRWAAPEGRRPRYEERRVPGVAGHDGSGQPGAELGAARPGILEPGAIVAQQKGIISFSRSARRRLVSARRAWQVGSTRRATSPTSRAT